MALILRLSLMLLLLPALAGCKTEHDKKRLARLEAMAAELAATDTVLIGKLDVTRAAVLRVMPTGKPSDSPPPCDGYCLRLLYGGEAKVVVSGYVDNPDRFVEDLAMRFGPQPRGVTGKGPTLIAYHLEKRAHCPDVAFEESEELRLPRQDFNRPEQTAADMAAQRMASGECLIAGPATFAGVTTAITVTQVNFYDLDLDLRLDSLQVTAYASSPAGHVMRVRKTKSSYSYHPQFVPKWITAPQAAKTDSRNWPDILRADFHLALAEVRPVTDDLRVAVDNVLDNAALAPDSAQFQVIDVYLQHLAQPYALTTSDVAVLQKVVTDQRVSERLTFLPDVVAIHYRSLDALADPLLQEMLAPDVESGRLKILARASSRLSVDSVSAHEDVFLRLASDRSRLGSTYPVIARLGDVTSDRALPVLAALIKDDSDAFATRMAMEAVCDMGAGAASLKPVVSHWLTKYPQPADELDYSVRMTRMNAWAFLHNLSGSEKESCDRLSV